MPLTLDEVHDAIDSWLIDPAVETLGPANELLATMAVGDPGRIDVLQVIASHQAPLLLDLRSRAGSLPADARDFIAEALEASGRLKEAMRWFTIGLRDLDPQDDLPDPDEESALIGRRRVRRALELPPDHYDELARIAMDARRVR